MKVTCGLCGAVYRIPEEKLTKDVSRTTCKRCSTKIIIRRPVIADESFDDLRAGIVATVPDIAGSNDEDAIIDHDKRTMKPGTVVPAIGAWVPISSQPLQTLGDEEEPTVMKKPAGGSPPTIAEDEILEEVTVPLDDLAFLVSLYPVAGNLYLLPPSGKVVLGRSRSVFSNSPVLMLPDEGVSRRHCEIERREDGYVVRDLGSSNGTQVNEFNVSTFPLKTGDEIAISSNWRFLFVSKIRASKNPLVNFKELRSELCKRISEPGMIKMVCSDADIPEEQVPSGSTEVVWYEVLTLIRKKSDFAALERLLETIEEEGYKSNIFAENLGRLRGVKYKTP